MVSTLLAGIACSGADVVVVPSDHEMSNTFAFDGLDDSIETRMSTETDG